MLNYQIVKIILIKKHLVRVPVFGDNIENIVVFSFQFPYL